MTQNNTMLQCYTANDSSGLVRFIFLVGKNRSESIMIWRGMWRNNQLRLKKQPLLLLELCGKFYSIAFKQKKVEKPWWLSMTPTRSPYNEIDLPRKDTEVRADNRRHIGDVFILSSKSNCASVKWLSAKNGLFLDNKKCYWYGVFCHVLLTDCSIY